MSGKIIGYIFLIIYLAAGKKKSRPGNFSFFSPSSYGFLWNYTKRRSIVNETRMLDNTYVKHIGTADFHNMFRSDEFSVLISGTF